MQNQKKIIDCYNKTAKNYADKFIDELHHKHLDSILLKSFAAENINKGKCIDLGCGPGQTTKFLFDCGMKHLTGIDISPTMIEVAKKINPMLQFEVADMLSLHYADKSFASAVAFYSIVHFDYEQIKIAFLEIKRILKENGQILFSFHVGDKIIHQSNFLDQAVDIDFYFFETNKIIELLKDVGFGLVDVIEREPYSAIEYASKRAYIWAGNNAHQ